MHYASYQSTSNGPRGQCAALVQKRANGESMPKGSSFHVPEGRRIDAAAPQAQPAASSHAAAQAQPAANSDPLSLAKDVVEAANAAQSQVTAGRTLGAESDSISDSSSDLGSHSGEDSSSEPGSDSGLEGDPLDAARGIQFFQQTQVGDQFCFSLPYKMKGEKTQRRFKCMLCSNDPDAKDQLDPDEHVCISVCPPFQEALL